MKSIENISSDKLDRQKYICTLTIIDTKDITTDQIELWIVQKCYKERGFKNIGYTKSDDNNSVAIVSTMYPPDSFVIRYFLSMRRSIIYNEIKNIYNTSEDNAAWDTISIEENNIIEVILNE